MDVEYIIKFEQYAKTRAEVTLLDNSPHEENRKRFIKSELTKTLQKMLDLGFLISEKRYKTLFEMWEKIQHEPVWWRCNYILVGRSESLYGCKKLIFIGNIDKYFKPDSNQRIVSLDEFLSIYPTIK